MKVQKIVRAVDVDLPERWRTAGRDAGIRGREAVDTGASECAPGTCRRKVKEVVAEVMHVRGRRRHVGAGR
ncbi:hypothetical protein [Burkholderia sp. Bp9142]|uniref:hypothetical protein n=1 Tax=Burkholderia sp. Bp9142 TaxID=2184573 RepID=UPI001625F09C|nr:hypothetical protein [Burkholderia sp. Bp9142]